MPVGNNPTGIDFEKEICMDQHTSLQDPEYALAILNDIDSINWINVSTR